MHVSCTYRVSWFLVSVRGQARSLSSTASPSSFLSTRRYIGPEHIGHFRRKKKKHRTAKSSSHRRLPPTSQTDRSLLLPRRRHPLRIFQAFPLVPYLGPSWNYSGSWMGFLLAEALFVCGFVMSYLAEMHCCFICRWFLRWIQELKKLTTMVWG